MLESYVAAPPKCVLLVVYLPSARLGDSGTTFSSWIHRPSWLHVRQSTTVFLLALKTTQLKMREV